MATHRKSLSASSSSPRLMPRLLGWLSIADHIDSVEWEKRFCVLAKEERRLYFMSESENQLSPPGSPSSRITEALDIDNLSTEPSPFKRGGQLTRSFHGLRNSLKRPKNSSKQNVVESKSVSDGLAHSKVESSRSFKNDQLRRVQQSFADKRRLGASLDNLEAVMHDSTETSSKSLGAPGTWLDLATAGHLHIEALHQSISPKHSCFRIITDNGTLYASCGSQEELQKWIVHLQAFRMPQKIFVKRLDTQLNMWILEAKNFPPKKKFFAQIYLDNYLYAQTCAKCRVDDTLFWGEPFTFVSPPSSKNVVVKVYKDNYSTGKKSSKKDKYVELGTITIPLEDIRGHEVEKWYQVKVHPSAQQKILSNSREIPSIRIKGLSQVVSILPLKCYDHFRAFLSTNYSPMCDALEHLISAKCKDEIAQTLIRIFQISGIAKEFLVEIVTNEVKKIDNENLVFRGNTFATKAVDTYMKMVGEKYLQDTLHSFIVDLIEHKPDCEVDPAKVSSGTNLEHNQQALTELVRRAWNSILGSDIRFPTELQSTFYGIRQKFGTEREDLCFKLISGSIFLRFFCPAILSPSLFHLCQEYPDEKTARKLKLVAKVIMTLANFTRFGAKEDYMFFMNDFVEQQIPSMKKFIKNISAPVSVSESATSNSDVISCHIDLGRELSIMHGILKEHIHKLSSDSMSHISNLPKILADIGKASDDEHPDPLTTPYDTLQSYPQASTGEPYITDSSSDLVSTASSCCSPTEDQENVAPPLPPPRKPTPTLSPTSTESDKPLHHVNGSVKGFQQQFLSNPKSNSLPTSQSTSPLPVRQLKHSLQSTNKDLTNSLNKSHKIPVQQSYSTSELVTSPRLHQSFHDLYGDQPTNLDDAIVNVLNSMPHQNNAELMKENEMLKEKLSQSEGKGFKQELEISNLKQELLRVEEVKKQLEAEMSLILKTKGDTILGLREHLQEAKDRWVRDQQKMHREVETSLRNHHKMQHDLSHLKSTVDEMQKALKAKDRLLQHRERQIACLLEANRTLGNGLDELQSLPKHSSSAEDSEDEIVLPGVVVNNSCHFQAMHQSELMQVISSLDKGNFDFS